MPKPRLILTGLFACAITTTSCAGSPPISSAAPSPRLTLPPTAERPCELHRLPEDPTVGDLEVGYMTRGAQIAACDGARQLAVDTLKAERGLGDRQAAMRAERALPWWRRLF